MVWKELTEGLAEALRAAGLHTPERMARLELAVPRDGAHGDWTTNLALLIAKEVRRPPRQVAEAIAAAFPPRPDLFAAVEVAGPGFLNFRYSEAFVDALPGTILRAGGGFGTSDAGAGRRVLVEYVSANPTGPLNIVSARAAAVGDTLVRLLRATGHEASGEFYVNDAGRQVNLLGESVAARFAEAHGLERAFPEDGYRGDYVRDLAADLPADEARVALESDDRGDAWFRDQALERMTREQRRDLEEYGTRFDRWFRESELHRSGEVEETLRALGERGVTYRASRPEVDDAGAGPAPHDETAEPGEATWLATGRFGDSKDRVIVRSNGTPTYLLPDLAYHRDKHDRGFDVAIDLWGPDHHAYVSTMKAALAALGLAPSFLEVLIVQQVNLWQKGADGKREQVKMSKRHGRLITLRDLVEDVGADCARFLFLMRSTSAHLDFDLDEARARNDENPSYYVQMAHARIAGILRYAAERGLAPETGAPTRLAPAEFALARRLAAFPELVRGAAVAREPHRLPGYLVETAAEFHRFYHDHRVVTDDVPLSRSRLRLCEATRTVIANGLALMGASAPQRMERAEEEARS